MATIFLFLARIREDGWMEGNIMIIMTLWLFVIVVVDVAVLLTQNYR
jgi:hypothetical protein